MESNLTTLAGIVKPGHQVASGNAEDSPYERGTLEMQLPFFQQLGLDLSGFFLGTLNISIAPHVFRVIQPKYTFKRVKWHPNYAPETFSFSPCKIMHRKIIYEGWIYYPHPETKIGHFQDDSILEAIAPKIPHLDYGDRLILGINPQEIELDVMADG
ncbi:hypothetical protein IQ255_10020 [Pleurocapsales cyanobacterium LEGE 10410]|nr:hypothetical protein [Pleurocapsales cyanobacterium LEGE 10410]